MCKTSDSEEISLDSRFVLAANGIVAVYSLVEMVASVWEITTGATLFPEVYQVWFDFGHDQVSLFSFSPLVDCDWKQPELSGPNFLQSFCSFGVKFKI